MFDLDKELTAAYKDALKTLKKKNAAFFEKWQQVMSGQIQPPQWYVDNDMVDYWRNGFLNELARQYHVEQQIMDEINRAGGKASKGIQQASQIEYAHGYQGEVTRIVTDAYKAGLVMTPVIDKRAVQIAVNDAQIMSPFSKVKYKSLGENMQVRRRLQRELGASIAAGESRAKLMQRILNVVGNAQYNAKRTAQTELNRVRNQSQYEADQYIHEAYGLETKRVWHCRFVNSRDGHMATEGQYEDADGGWWVSGEHLKFPGDPQGSAWNVINCHCQTESELVTNSPAMQALRERNAARRREWLQHNAEHNKDEQNWRRGNSGVQQVHPYARRNWMLADSKRAIIPITDAAIEKVPRITHDGWNDTLTESVNKACKDVLRLSRDNNNNMQTAIAVSGDGLRTKVAYGEKNQLYFGSLVQTIGQQNSVLVHNHPSGSITSFEDCATFLSHDQLSAIVAVKNNGGVEYITKTLDYDAEKAYNIFKRSYKDSLGKDYNACEKILKKMFSKMQQGCGVKWQVLQ